MKNFTDYKEIGKLFKYVFLIAVLVIGYIAYTGIDVTTEYDAISKVRNQALDNVFDPLAKKMLKQTSEFNLDEIIESSIEKYSGENNEM